MGSFFRGGKNGMGCYVQGNKNSMGRYVQGDKNSMGCFVQGGKSLWDVLSGVSKNGMGCFVRGCFVWLPALGYIRRMVSAKSACLKEKVPYGYKMSIKCTCFAQYNQFMYFRLKFQTEMKKMLWFYSFFQTKEKIGTNAFL